MHRLENLTRSGRMFVPGSGVRWTNGLDGSDGSDFTVQIGDGRDFKMRNRNFKNVCY